MEGLRLWPLTSNCAFSNGGTAIGLRLDILQFLLLCKGNGVSKTTVPADGNKLSDHPSETFPRINLVLTR